MRESLMDHADWMRRASRILEEEERAGRGVEPHDGVWFVGAGWSGRDGLVDGDSAGWGSSRNEL